MVIRASRAGEIEPLIAALGSDSSVDREAAVARLRVIGQRAIERLTAFLQTAAPPTARAAALEALFDSDDHRTLDIGLDNLAHAEADVAVAAVGVLRGWVTREPGTRVLDALTGAALDQTRHARVRLAALDALSSLPRDVVGPVLQHAPAVEAGGEPQDATEAREWLAAREDAPLSALHDFVARAARQKGRDWLVARGAAHAVLARRGSKVALYDLREAFDAAREPLPLDFLTAANAIGDASLLEPLARAWAAAPATETWWRERLADTATEIMHRTRLSGRSAVVKRIRGRFHGFV